MNLEKFLDDIKAVVQDGEQLLKAGANQLKGRAVSGAKSTDRYVRTHPYQTLGIVLGVGLFIGLLASGAFGGHEEHELEEAE